MRSSVACRVCDSGGVCQESERDLPTEGTDDELDTEGQAFKWGLVDEKGTTRLRQTWTPDEPKPSQRGGEPSKDTESHKKSS